MRCRPTDEQGMSYHGSGPLSPEGGPARGAPGLFGTGVSDAAPGRPAEAAGEGRADAPAWSGLGLIGSGVQDLPFA